MGKKGIIVHLELEENLKLDPGEEYPILEKNMGTDKTILVKELFEYMVHPAKDELNPEGYTPAQEEVAKIARNTYLIGGINNPNLKYRSNSEEINFMFFEKKLSYYPDAFCQKNNNVEFGNLEEEILEENVYLIATDQATGGRKIY